MVVRAVAKRKQRTQEWRWFCVWIYSPGQ